MFDKFREFDSAAEINAAAAGQKAEGDNEAIIEIALENGLDKEDAQDYIDGVVDELCNPLMAALGKIKLESEILKPKEIVEDWIGYIKNQCEKDPLMAAAVRKKDKSVKECIAKLLKWSFANAYSVDEEIVKAAGISAKVKMGIPGMGRAYMIIKNYYLGGDEK